MSIESPIVRQRERGFPSSSAARVQALVDAEAGALSAAITAIKAGDVGPALQREFFERTFRPLATKR